MAGEHGIIAIKVERSATGLFTATSDDLEGVYVAHRDLDKIIEDMPAIVEQWFKVRRKEDMTVFRGPVTPWDGGVKIPAIPVPAQIAAKAIAR